MATIIEMPYGQAGTFRINLLDNAGLLFDNAITLVAGDFNGQTDGGTVGSLATLPVATNLGYTVAVSAAEVTGQIFNIQGESGNFWNDQWIVETTGHPLAKHPYKNLDTGLSIGITTGVPTTTSIPTDIQAEAGANTLADRIASWINPNGSYGQERISANTAGANTTLTLGTAVSVAPANGARIIIL